MASLPKSAVLQPVPVTSAEFNSNGTPSNGTTAGMLILTAAPAGDGHGGHGEVKFPPFDPASFASQLIWLAISFGALYMLLSRIALPKVGGVLAERADRIRRDLGDAERMKTETDAALKAYEQSLADARGKAQTIAKDTREKIGAQLDRDRHRADQDNATKIAEMEKQIAGNKARALANVGDIAADTAGSIVAKLLGRDIPADEIRNALQAHVRGS